MGSQGRERRKQAAVLEATEEGVRTYCREKIEAAIDRDGGLSVAEYAHQTFVALSDREKAVFAEPGYHAFVLHVVAATRRPQKQKGERLKVFIDKRDIQKIDTRLLAQINWGTYLEYDPQAGCHIRLLEMQKHNLLAAAEYRRKQATGTIKRAQLDEALAERLEEGENVGERWTVQEISEAWVKINSA